MSNILFVALAGFAFFFLLPAASADPLSSILHKAAARAAPVDDDRAVAPYQFGQIGISQLGGVQQSNKNPHFHFGDVGYRFSKRGFKAIFQYGGISAMAQVGESGKHRLELDSPMLPKNSTLALSDDGNGTVRIELKYGF